MTSLLAIVLAALVGACRESPVSIVTTGAAYAPTIVEGAFSGVEVTMRLHAAPTPEDAAYVVIISTTSWAVSGDIVYGSDASFHESLDSVSDYLQGTDPGLVVGVWRIEGRWVATLPRLVTSTHVHETVTTEWEWNVTDTSRKDKP
jgi:hypothetical protein